MKNLSIIRLKSISFIIVALLLLGITVFTENIQPDHTKNSNTLVDNYTANSSLSQEKQAEAQQESGIYTVKEHNGIIAVFKGNEQLSIMHTKVPVSNLPSEDKSLLKKGVEFSSYKDMLFFLENYE